MRLLFLVRNKKQKEVTNMKQGKRVLWGYLIVMLTIFFALTPDCWAEFKGIKLELPIEFNTSNSSVVKKTYLDGWENKFVPRGGSMSITDQKSHDVSMDIGLLTEAVWSIPDDWKFIGGTKISLVTFYTFVLFSEDEVFSFSEEVGSAKVDWWDEVKLLSVRVKKTSPAVGIAWYFTDKWKIQYAAQTYELFFQDYKGKDNIGARNTSSKDGTREIEDGISHRIDLGYVVEMFDDKTLGINLFYEQIGSKVRSGGITFIIPLKTFFK